MKSFWKEKKMKKILLLICLLLFSLVMGRYGESGSTLNTEKIKLSIDFFGSCKQFFKNELFISRSLGNCLPINVSEDNSDLDADVRCYKGEEDDMSRIDFVRVFSKNDRFKTYKGRFVVSFVPFSFFKSNVGVYARRPNCKLNKDGLVDECFENSIDFKSGFIVTKDLIYVASKGIRKINTCKKGSFFCPYLSSNGICPHIASRKHLHNYNPDPKHRKALPSKTTVASSPEIPTQNLNDYPIPPKNQEEDYKFLTFDHGKFEIYTEDEDDAK